MGRASMAGPFRQVMRILRTVLLASIVVLAGCENERDEDPVGVSPPGLAEVIQVFATSGYTKGDTGGLAGGDAFCTQAASDAQLSGNWTAWLSDRTIDARARIVDAEYRRLDDQVIASDKADLVDGKLDWLINMDENGGAIIGPAWTGTSGDGTAVAALNCADWTSSSLSDEGIHGFPGANDSDWTDGLRSSCDTPNHLYCFADTVILVARWP